MAFSDSIATVAYNVAVIPAEISKC
jgi:hypothetical protein